MTTVKTTALSLKTNDVLVGSGALVLKTNLCTCHKTKVNVEVMYPNGHVAHRLWGRGTAMTVERVG